MGNSPSNNNVSSQEVPTQNINQSNNKTEKNKLLEGDEAFNKIKFLSNEILEKYQNHFLDKGFCDKVALIYKKKLNELDINVLRNIHNKMNGEDKELKVMLQYIPQNDNRFFVDFFKDKLNDFFWNKGIKYNKTIFAMNNIKTNNLDKFLHSNLFYINPSHVKKILKTFDTLNAFEENQNQNGGQSPEQNNQSKYSSSNNFQQNLLKQLQNLEENQTHNNNQETNDISNIINEVPINSIEELPRENNNNNEMQSIRVNNRQNQPTRANNRETQSIRVNNRQNQPTRANNRETQSIRVNNNKRNKANDQKRNIKNENNLNREKIKLNHGKNNKKSKYYVPQWYKEPIDFCSQNNKSGSCVLTKSQLCKSITQNLVIRNNIIAAILTTIPQKTIDKKGNVSYEGGICFQKFLNLEKGFVCLPFNYRELSTKSISEAIPELMKKSNFLDQESCIKNNGFYLKLTTDEKETLKKRAMSTEEEFKAHPHYKANKSYLEFIIKLKNKYFESLNALIMILEELKEHAFVSNETLNTISLKTKNIIDEMYNYTNKYYVYALFALIQSDYIEKKDPKAEQLNQIIQLSEGN